MKSIQANFAVLVWLNFVLFLPLIGIKGVVSDPGYPDAVSFGVVSTFLSAADMLHLETFLSPAVKARVNAASNFLFCNECQMSNLARIVV